MKSARQAHIRHLKEVPSWTSFLNNAGFCLRLLCATCLFLACAPNNPEEIKALTNKDELPTLSFVEFEGIATDSGTLKYRLVTPEILQFDNVESPFIDFPKGLHYYTYNKDEEIESQIKCNYAKYYQELELWVLQNDVEIINAEGSVVNSEHIFWNTKEKRIYSDEFVKITTQDDLITGYGFETDEDIKTFTILKVSGEFGFEE
ncbi:MAG: LPS export ABC transporter periplasmic protein LptC [Marinilabiliaceae bacterium]|nr:LPS export ABC transporter periplasmic protein LptC [Marinilabiliaceae bacterium]